jgi:hypothetical protein
MPRTLRLILSRTLAAVARLTRRLARGAVTVDAWRDAMAETLRTHHAAALLAGQGGGDLSTPSRRYLDLFVEQQLRYLRRFANEVAQNGYTPRDAARAAMYAGAAKAPYWHGRTKGLPLPAMPGDGTTQCLSNCRCSWEIVNLEGDGNADCYWRMAADEHCQTCTQRASDWAPLRVRDGELQ